MKTYFDLLLSKNMSSKFSSLAFGNLLIFCLIFVFDNEFKIIKYFAELSGFGFYKTYWLTSLFLGCFAIISNIAVYLRFSAGYTPAETDFKKSVKYINKKRKTTDLFSRKVIYQSYPKSLVITFVGILLFSVYVAVNNTIVMPLLELSGNKINSSQVVKHDMSFFFGLGVMSYIPAYILLVIGMLIKSLNSCSRK